MQGWSRQRGRGRARLAYRPSLERVESRELMSGIIASMLVSQPSPIHRQAAAVQSQAVDPLRSDNGGIPGAPTPPFSPGTGEPTPHEVARQRFRAVFSGPLYAGGPRFTDQKKLLYFRGLGGSTMFLHGDYQMGIVFPKDPAKPIVGGAYLQDKNINSGSVIGFDLTFDPNSLDRHGRPTLGTFTEDPNVYGGAFFSPTSSGTVKIRYARNTATVLFQGQVYTSGLTNQLTNQDLQERGG
ncbi:MAG: hypothetical protein ABI353_10520 [Isosphaeraceae bacterium]